MAWIAVVVLLIAIIVFVGVAFYVYVQNNGVNVTVNHVVSLDEDINVTSLLGDIPDFEQVPDWLEDLKVQYENLKGGE